MLYVKEEEKNVFYGGLEGGTERSYNLIGVWEQGLDKYMRK